MRSAFIFLYALLYVNSLVLGQKEILGKSIKSNSFDNIVPIQLMDDYGVFIQTFKFADIAALRLVYSNTSEEAFADKFNLIKYDITSGQIKIFNYKINRHHIFKAYSSDKNNCYILSKNVEQKQLIYYLDVIDLKTFEHKVKNKQVVKYTSRQNHKIISFKLTTLGLMILIEKDEVVNGNMCLEVFFISKENKVVKYHLVKIPTAQKKYEFSRIYEWRERSYVVYQSIRTNDIAVVKLDSDTCYQYGLSIPNIVRLDEAFMSNEKSVISICYAENSFYPNAIVTSILGEDESITTEIPSYFNNQLRSWSGTVQGNEIFYQYSLFQNEVILIETYKVIITDNGNMFKKYGPRILIKIDQDGEIAWDKNLSEWNIVNIKYGRNLSAFANEDSFFLLYQTKLTGLTLAKIDIATGRMNSRILSISKPWLKSNIGNDYCDQESNRALIVLGKQLTRIKPLLISF